MCSEQRVRRPSVKVPWAQIPRDHRAKSRILSSFRDHRVRNPQRNSPRKRPAGCRPNSSDPVSVDTSLVQQGVKNTNSFITCSFTGLGGKLDQRHRDNEAQRRNTQAQLKLIVDEGARKGASGLSCSQLVIPIWSHIDEAPTIHFISLRLPLHSNSVQFQVFIEKALSLILRARAPPTLAVGFCGRYFERQSLALGGETLTSMNSFTQHKYNDASITIHTVIEQYGTRT
jgi:hypothetical protein